MSIKGANEMKDKKVINKLEASIEEYIDWLIDWLIDWKSFFILATIVQCGTHAHIN